jgi:hypothetical protein
VLRVASVPASHVYVQHLSDPDGCDEVVRLDDPVPQGCTVPGRWWPPAMLEPGWVTGNHDSFDVFHLHFGFDAIAPDVLESVLHELKVHDKPFVYTVHDLRNPHHPQRAAHDEQQDVLVSAAHTLITLTPGAAQEISRRWEREAVVLPHPHVLDRARIDAPRPGGGPFIVAVHAKSVRANTDPLTVLDALVPIVAEIPDAILRINVHDELFQPGNRWHADDLGGAIRRYAEHRHVEVHVHPYFTDDELWDYLSGVSVSVLAYRFGTHSGWLEACFDLGTGVIASSCGFYAEQRPCDEFELTETTFDAESLRRAVHASHDRWRAGQMPRATWDQRHAERTAVARTHHDVYTAALA